MGMVAARVAVARGPFDGEVGGDVGVWGRQVEARTGGGASP